MVQETQSGRCESSSLEWYERLGRPFGPKLDGPSLGHFLGLQLDIRRATFAQDTVHHFDRPLWWNWPFMLFSCDPSLLCLLWNGRHLNWNEPDIFFYKSHPIWPLDGDFCNESGNRFLEEGIIWWLEEETVYNIFGELAVFEVSIFFYGLMPCCVCLRWVPKVVSTRKMTSSGGSASSIYFKSFPPSMMGLSGHVRTLSGPCYKLSIQRPWISKFWFPENILDMPVGERSFRKSEIIQNYGFKSGLKLG